MNELDKKPVWEMDIVHYESYDLGRNVGWNECLKAIQMNRDDNWIPCSERLPEVPEVIDDDYCPEFNVTIKGADGATTLKCAPDGTWFDDFGEVYDVIAWQPLPEPYRAADDSKAD